MATYSKTLTGSTTPTGVVRKVMPKLMGQGFTYPNGVLPKRVSKVLAASLTSTGTLPVKLPLKIFAGSTTPTGTVRKVMPKLMGQGYTYPNGVLPKQLRRKFTGSLNATGFNEMTFIGRIFGRPGIVVMRFVQRATVSIRHRRG